MKKLLALVLVVAIFLCGAFFIYTLAESADPAPAAGVRIDITGLVIAVLLAVFEFLLSRFGRVLIPPAKAWLEAHTTQKERDLLWNAVCELVDAAEQIIKGPNLGARRKAYVEAGLAQRGLKIDDDMIEAAVKQMNDRMMAAMGTVFGATLHNADDPVPVPLDENGEPDLEITHWNAAQLKSFCALNGIPAEGCVTKEDYLWAIERGAVTGMDNSETDPTVDVPTPAADCSAKDWCDLDEDGNAIPESPQSVNE